VAQPSDGSWSFDLISDVKRVASFDRQIDRVKGIQRVEP